LIAAAQPALHACYTIGMFADTPAPPYTAVIFTSLRTEEDDDGYAAMATAMDEQARLQPGYLGIESARGADGLGITVSYWRTADDARAWKRVAEHAGAQRLGRERWYRAYRVRVAEVSRAYGADRA
jgi:heme-degrading monooxygenase HmoA